MAKNINNLTSAIKAKINKYSNNAIISEEGKVISVGDGIVIVSGLNNVMLNEMVKFENGNYGMALNLEEDYTGIVMLGNYANIVENSIVKRTHKVISIGVGDAVSGRIINSLGEPIDGKGLIKYDHFEPIDTIAPGVMERQSVDKPLETGILAIDSMFPIGRGQRELIIGDRQTGKTSVAIDTIINQKNKSVHCVYVAIGQKNSSVVQVASTLATYGALSYTTIISATASDIPALKYIAPFSGMTIAEYWMKKGQDVLIIFDDLTKHAHSYRAISLLLRRPPGREAYPGDIFYLHSRLLERAGRLNKDHGSGSITALPIIETQAGDISAYIPTNVISITDGQLFMIASLFNEGQRPAIDVGLSVSRVGSTAQIKAIKQVAGNLKLDLAQYSELSSFSQFGSDLDENTRDILEHGKRIMTMMKQPLCKPIDQIDQAILLLCVKYRLIKWIPTNLISKFSNGLITYFKDSSLRKKLAKDKKFDDKLFDEFAKEIKKQILKFVTGIKDYNFNKYGSKDEFAKLKIK